ncbi:MAG TPA: hypothetical protein DCS93_37705 [Microscillaceae bacterium]|nr:hypothetical protein [Microscillaceae bacterium]
MYTNQYKNYLGLLLVAGLLTMSFTWMAKDRTKLLSRQWIMTGMEVNGKAISDKMLERQQRSGILTILEFRPNGNYNVRISTPKGRTTKRNKWRFEDKQKKLVIIAKESGKETEQAFDILKISSKKLILSLKDRRETQIFIYKAYKPKKRRR